MAWHYKKDSPDALHLKLKISLIHNTKIMRGIMQRDLSISCYWLGSDQFLDWQLIAYTWHYIRNRQVIHFLIRHSFHILDGTTNIRGIRMHPCVRTCLHNGLASLVWLNERAAVRLGTREHRV